MQCAVSVRGAGLSLMQNVSVDSIREACLRLFNEPSPDGEQD